MQGREAGNSAPSSVKIKNCGAIPPLHHMSSYSSSYLKQRDNILLFSLLIFIFFMTLSETESRDSSVGIATGYGLHDPGVGVRVPVWSEFSLLHVV
jgi:hypothetical protein